MLPECQWTRLLLHQTNWKKIIEMIGFLVFLTISYLLVASNAQFQEIPVDYPMLISVPATQFSCRGRLPGYYADPHPASKCQAYHMCNQLERIYSYLCPNFTLFHQERLICDHWYRVNCSEAESFYSVNENLYEENKVRSSRNKQVLQKTSVQPPTPRLRSTTPAPTNDFTQLFVRQGLVLPGSNIVTRPRGSGQNQQVPSRVTKFVALNQQQDRNELSLTTARFTSSRRRVTTVRPPVGVDQARRTVGPVVNCFGCLPHYFTDPFTCTPCVKPR